MNTQELELFVQSIKPKENGFIGFYYDDEDHHEYCSYIKANKEGLLMYAVEILQAYLKTEDKEIYKISNQLELNNSDFRISHIELTNKTKYELEKPKGLHKQTWKEKLLGLIAVGTLIFILISILIGAVTIIDWLV